MVRIAQRAIGFSRCRIEFESLGGRVYRASSSLDRRQRADLNRAKGVVTISQAHVSRGIARVLLDRTLQMLDGFVEILFRAFVPIEIPALQIMIKGLRRDGTSGSQACLFRGS